MYSWRRLWPIRKRPCSKPKQNSMLPLQPFAVRHTLRRAPGMHPLTPCPVLPVPDCACMCLAVQRPQAQPACLGAGKGLAVGAQRGAGAQLHRQAVAAARRDRIVETAARPGVVGGATAKVAGLEVERVAVEEEDRKDERNALAAKEEGGRDAVKMPLMADEGPDEGKAVRTREAQQAWHGAEAGGDKPAVSEKVADASPA